MPTPTPGPDSEDVALSLTLAVVAASPSPLLLLNGDFVIVAASDSFHQAFGIALESLAERSLFALSDGAWDIPELRRLLDATLSGETQSDDCEFDLSTASAPPRRLVVQARRL